MRSGQGRVRGCRRRRRYGARSRNQIAGHPSLPLPTRPRREDTTEYSEITLHKAASYPPLQKTQGRGTLGIDGARRNPRSKGGPPAFDSQRTPLRDAIVRPGRHGQQQFYDLARVAHRGLISNLRFSTLGSILHPERRVIPKIEAAAQVRASGREWSCSILSIG